VRQQRWEFLLEIDDDAGDGPQALLQAGLLIRALVRDAGAMSIGSCRVARI
jgi:hypothetical protein